MQSDRWQQIKDLHDAVLPLGEKERKAALDAACNHDPELRREVESLLAYENRAANFLESPAYQVFADALGPEESQGGGSSGGLVGQTVSHYHIIEKLGAGGMGVVYKAEDSHLHRFVALKFLPDEVARDPQVLSRFRREAQAASALNHPNICTIHDLSEEAGKAFIAMEFIEGQSLRHMMSGRHFNIEQLLQIGIEVADGLDTAHQKGIIHRDIKPENIFINSRGNPKILDFGLAKMQPRIARSSDEVTISQTGGLTEQGVAMGTVAYMSPEQARGEILDARTDLFSFGAVLYEMVTGSAPFKGTTSAVIFDALLNRMPTRPAELNPDISPEMERIVAKSLEKDRDLRYQTAAELRGDLKRFKRDLESGSTTAGVTIRRPRATRSLMWVSVAIGVVFLTVCALIAIPKLRRPAAIAPTEWQQITDFSDYAVQPSLSPDGHMLTFIRGPEWWVTSGQIYVKFLPDGEPLALTHDDYNKADPVFSADGSRVTYTVVDGFNWNTYEIPVTASKPNLFLPNASGLTWINGQRLLFSEIREGIHMGVVTAGPLRDGEHDVYFPKDLHGMAHRSYVSPDGRWVVLVEMLAPELIRCRLLPLDGSLPGNPIGPDGGCDSAAWSPDGKWIYLTSDGGGVTRHIWRVRFPDGAPEQITSDPSGESGIAMAPDGKSLITSVGTAQGTVWLHDEKGDHQISSEGYAYFPYINAQGTRLTYLQQDRKSLGTPGKPIQNPEIKLMSVDLHTLVSQQVFSGPDVGDYCIPPDGRELVYAARDRNDRVHLWNVPLDHSLPPKRITPEENDDRNIMCFDDGDVGFTREENDLRGVYRMKPDGSGMRKFVFMPILDVAAMDMDGSSMAAVVKAGREKTRVMIYNLRDGTAKDLCDSCSPMWSPDDKKLYVSFAYFDKGNSKEHGQTYVLPWKPNLKSLPPGGTRTEADVAKIAAVVPEARGVPEFAPGMSRQVYAFSRRTIQRNLYRIPLPPG